MGWKEGEWNGRCSASLDLSALSTVSKVFRQKEKYLIQDDGSKSPVKRAKGRSPDIERALAVWAKDQVSPSSHREAYSLLTAISGAKKSPFD